MQPATDRDAGAAAAAPAEPPLHSAMRALLVAFTALTLLAFVALFVRADATDRYFAWTIAPPLSAAFLGAAYAAGCVLVTLSLRTGSWAVARGPVVTVLVFAVLTLVASLLRLDRFHLDDDGLIARGAAWWWLGVYVALPPVMAVAIALQARGPAPRRDPVAVRLPRPLRGLLVAEGALMAAVGLVLLLRPAAGTTFWAWPLTPLVAQVVAAWLVAFGVAAALAVREDDLRRLRVPAVAYTAFGALELLALARYAGEPDWSDPRPWAYLGTALAVTATGAAGWALSRRP